MGVEVYNERKKDTHETKWNKVKNAWKNDGNLMNGRSAKKKMHMKIMGVERTEDLTKKKDECKMNGKCEKCI